MMVRNSVFRPVLASIAVIFIHACSRDKGISNKVPPLELPTWKDKAIRVHEFKDELVLLVFWATWCQPCIMEIPSLNALHEKYRDHGFRVVSVNVDDGNLDHVGTVVREQGINYEVLMGDEKTMARFGGVRALPTSFLVAKGGRIVDRMEGLLPESMLEGKIRDYFKTS